MQIKSSPLKVQVVQVRSGIYVRTRMEDDVACTILFDMSLSSVSQQLFDVFLHEKSINISAAVFNSYPRHKRTL